jgi:archaellum biogenesis ATPase FlaH
MAQNKKELHVVLIEKEDNLIDALRIKLLSHNKVCLVILNNIYSNLVNTMKNTNLPVDRFYFIDTLSCQTQKIKNCESIAPNISSIMESMDRAVNSKKCDLVAIDNINSLLSYHPKDEIERMLNDLKRKDFNVNKILFCQKNEILKEEEEGFMKDMKLFADKIE